MEEIRVFVVAEDPLARAGLAALLSDQPEIMVVGQDGTGDHLIADHDLYRPDAVVWDLGWESPSSLEPLSDLAETDIPLLVLLPDEHEVTAVRLAGARSLLLREVNASGLLAALAALRQGLVVLDPSLVTSVFPSRDASSPSLVESLTPRELEVLQLLAEGLPNKGIALRLDISEHTVKFHVNAILGKLNAQSRTEAVTRATRLGLILL